MSNATQMKNVDEAALVRFTFRPLTNLDTCKLYEVHKSIVRELISNETYRQSTFEDYETFFKDRGLAIGVSDREQLVGFGLLSLPSPYVKRIARKLSAELHRDDLIGHLEECAVLQDYRNLGLHKQLTCRRLQVLSSLGYLGVTVTISPRNVASLKVMFDTNFLVMDSATLYGGHFRLILYRDLSIADPASVFVRCGQVDHCDDSEISRRLEIGQVGLGLSEDNGRISIVFGKRSDNAV